MKDVPKPVFIYRVRIERWVDGDTVDGFVDLGFRMWAKLRFRLAGINTAELHPRHSNFDTKEERAAHMEKAREAMRFCEAKAPAGSEVVMETGLESGKFGRYIATVFHDESGESLNDMLVEADLAERVQY